MEFSLSSGIKNHKNQGLWYSRKPEYVVFFLFLILYSLIIVFHEPWFDEAQAWQIAKCASLNEILFDIPHLEGHPPLWHMILLIPVKLGIPFEIGLKFVGFIISAVAAYLMIFCSKLPRPARFLFPFTYFFFYQYGVVVRPYGVMLVFMLLLGMNLNERKEHPWRLFFILAGLCFTHAFGILFAGGISACIVWELTREKSFVGFFKELFRDSRTLSLLVLLLWAVILMLDIYPSGDALGTSFTAESAFLLKLFCAVFTFPVECFLSTSSWFSYEGGSLIFLHIQSAEFIIFLVLGLLLWLLLVCSASKRTLKYLLVPYLIFAVFSAAVYFSTHHLGTAFLFILFWVEFISRSSESFDVGKALVGKLSKTDKDKVLFKSTAVFLCTACLLVPLYWSISASVHEITWAYSPARGLARFIKEHNLEEKLILYAWDEDGSSPVSALGNDNYINTDIVAGGVSLCAYFDHNIVLNLNNGGGDAYIHNRAISYEESRENVARWAEAGIPDLIIDFPNLELVYGDRVSFKDYSFVWMTRCGYIWKNTHRNEISLISVRNDLLEEYGLKSIQNKWLYYWLNGVEITQEMRDDYKNGVPMDEILDPVLDSIFGPESAK